MLNTLIDFLNHFLLQLLCQIINIPIMQIKSGLADLGYSRQLFHRNLLYRFLFMQL